MKDDSCIFCKLANGDIPTASLYEDDDFRVILDAGPASKGHALILPKDHADCLFTLPDETASKALLLARTIGKKLVDGLHADGLNIVQNNGAAAGQTVMHFHIHLIPRYDNDGVGIGWKPGTLTDEVRDEIIDLFE